MGSSLVSPVAVTTPPAAGDARPSPALARDGVLIGVAALGAYLLLGQNTLYHIDAHVMLQRIGEGVAIHENHFAYFPVVRLAHWLLAPLGLSLYRAARTASAVATALGVVLVHLANVRSRLSRQDAVLVTALVATSPAVLFFATVVEVHGVFFAAFGFAALATAWLIAQPRPASAVRTGVVLGLAYGAHATAALLPFALLTLAFVALRRQGVPARRAAALCVVATLVQAAVIAVMPSLIDAFGFHVANGDAAGHLRDGVSELTGRADWPGALPRLLTTETWREWIWPFYPLSLTWLLAWRDRGQRGGALALALALVPYLGITMLLLAKFPISEQGAYLLPLAWPAALLTVAAWGRRTSVAIVASCAVVAVLQVAAHDRPQRSLAFARGLHAVASDQPFCLLLGSYLDIEALFVRLPDADHVMLVDAAARTKAANTDRFLAIMDGELQRRLAEGESVYLTRGTETALAELGAHGGTTAGRVLEHLRADWRLTPVDRDGFHAYRVQSK